jgi:hypothetical protein
MGLDMYMRRKLYVKNYSYKGADSWKITVEKNGKPYKTKEISEVTESVGYWRKANQVHAWFVNNVQNGEDDCKEYYVDHDKLQELLKTVNTVLESTKLIPGRVHNGTRWTAEKGQEEIWEDGKVMADPSVAQELLPNQEGFFFGSTDYNEWYYQDLEYTKELLEELLNDPNASECSYYYEASW